MVSPIRIPLSLCLLKLPSNFSTIYWSSRFTILLYWSTELTNPNNIKLLILINFSQIILALILHYHNMSIHFVRIHRYFCAFQNYCVYIYPSLFLCFQNYCVYVHLPMLPLYIMYKHSMVTMSYNYVMCNVTVTM